MDRHPHVLRIVLAEMSDKDEAMKKADPVHQYLTKPYSSEKLKAVLTRACGLRDRLADEKLMGVVARMDSLPTVPAVYVQLMEELAAREPSMQKLGEIISMDVGLTGRAPLWRALCEEKAAKA